MITGELCADCWGTGLKSIKCEPCKGDGIISQEVKFCINIPHSVDTNMIMRVKEKGHQALNGSFGDLLIKINILPDKEFKRQGLNILSTVNVSVTQAILGSTISVDTIDGKHDLQIQPGTEQGAEFIIKGLGLKDIMDGRKRGDHIVTVKISVPKNLNKQQKQALENY